MGDPKIVGRVAAAGSRGVRWACFLVLESSAQAVEPPLSRPVFVLDWGRHLEARVRP